MTLHKRFCIVQQRVFQAVGAYRLTSPRLFRHEVTHLCHNLARLHRQTLKSEQNKITLLPKPDAPSSRCFNPTTLNWWTTNQEVERSYALVGTQAGCVLIVDLIDGKEIGFVRLSQEPIVRMETMSDPSGDNTYLFITDAESKQWRVLLERRSTSYVWCGSGTARVGSNKGPRSRSPIQDHQRRSSSDVDNSTTGGDSEELSTPMRSRFAGIRNMSVASLASLRQKLSEGKKMLDRRVNSSGGVGEGGCPDGSSPLGARVGCSGDATNIEAPEPLSKKIGGTRLFVQHQGGGSNIEPVLGGLFPGKLTSTWDS